MTDSARHITNLAEFVMGLPPEQRGLFDRIFDVSTTIGHLHAPDSMHKWIEGFFGSVAAVEEQHIVKVTNRVTFEGSLFNELRSMRPMETKESADVMETIRAAVGDPFCNPEQGTPEDEFGRVRGRHSVTASNIAKYDGFHGLVIFDEHDPLRFTESEIADYIDTAHRWAIKAHESDPRARFFFFMWNCLWKSGASILHGHAQMTVTRDHHYARVEFLRKMALRYRADFDTNYFDDLFEVHRALGLAWQRGQTRLISYLTPIKEKEMLLFAPRLDGDAKNAIYHMLEFYRGLGVTSFNLVIYLPPLDGRLDGWEDFPVVVRLVDRGDPMNRTADMGAMELYASSVVSSDPFAVADAWARYAAQHLHLPAQAS